MSDCSTNAFKVLEKPELLPCPHCGEKAYGDTFRVEGDRWLFSIKCNKCQAVTWSESKDLSAAQKEAIEAWNTRHESTCKWTINEQAIRGDFDAITECGHVFSFSECPVPDYCASCGGRVEVVN